MDTPASGSVHANDTVTETLFHPNTLAGGVLDPERFGAVLSMLIPPTVAEAVFPALSAHDAVRDCPGPSVETTCGVSGGVATPERLSEHVKLAATSPLFQP